MHFVRSVKEKRCSSFKSNYKDQNCLIEFKLHNKIELKVGYRRL